MENKNTIEFKETLNEFGKNGNYNENDFEEFSLWIDGFLANENTDLYENKIICCLNNNNSTSEGVL